MKNWKTTLISFAWFFLYFVIAYAIFAVVKPQLAKLPIVGSYFA